MKRTYAGLGGFLLPVVVGTLALTSAGFAGDEKSAATKNFTTESRHGESIPMRDLPTVYISVPREHFEHEPFEGPVSPSAMGKPGAARADAVHQRIPSISAATPTVGMNFEGEGLDDGVTGYDPPDSDGAVGATQYTEFINAQWAVFNKSDGSLAAGPTNLSSLFSSLGGACANYDNGDPIVQWDKQAQRWLVSQFALPQYFTGSGGYHECIAISKTSDATGAYWVYDFSYTDFNDYPKIGVFGNAYLVTYNLFGTSGDGYTGDELCALDRTNMLAGNPASQGCVTLTNEFGMLPADVDGSTPPSANSLGYFVGISDSSTLHLYTVTNLNFPASGITLVGPSSITVPSFTYACNGGRCIPQPATSNTLDSLGTRLMYRLSYRNFGSYEMLLVNHSVDPSGTGSGATGVRWYELHQPSPSGVLSGTFSVFQNGTFAPSDGNYRWMGSVAMDSYRNIAAGYSLSGPSNTPAIMVATRAPGDAAGTLGNETQIYDGTGVQTDPSGTDREPYRWGDYTSMTMDPVDDCTMWYINQYQNVDALYSWNTRIASFKIAGCGATPVAAAMVNPTPGSTLGGNSQTFSWDAGVGAQDYDIWVGTTAGGKDIANIDTFGAQSANVTGLPATGQGVYVTLLSKVNGTWSQFNKYLYTASGTSAPAVMNGSVTSPLPASTTFGWSAGTGVSQYSLYIGTTAGAHDIAYVNAGTATSATVSIPQNGEAVYVKLYSLIAGSYQSNSYTYVAGGTASKGTMNTPTPGTKISGGSATFTWNAGSGVSQYTLYVGTTPGASNIAFVNAHQGLSAPVSGIPTNGSTIYVVLYSLIDGAYQHATYTYTTGP